ncbi:Ku protein [Streptomyces sp. NPDC023838]|uniref:non-homologous end joining protein Ku n=1 Tax=Streptomyces sp. NPDC023838 TaxID=3154325 RepID=UPI0033C339AF
MRSIWNGAISFGLVSIPIKLFNATESHSISFRQIHTEDGGRVRYRKVCELDGEELDASEIGKAYEDADGSLVPISDDDLAALPLPTAKTIEIVTFVPADSIDPLQIDAAYYLSAGGAAAAKPYTLLREALKRSRKVAIAKYALRGRERLGMLRVMDDVIAMHGLLWPDEIRAPEGVAPETDVKIRDAELDLADALMDTLGEVDVATLHDDYREAVETLIASKAGGALPPVEAPESHRGGKVIDLMAALEKSVRAARQARGEEAAEPAQEAEPAESAEVTELKSRKTAARKEAPAKKSAKAATRTTSKASTKTATKTTSKAASKSAAKTATKSTSKTAAKKSAASPKASAAGAKKSTATTAKKTAAKKTAPRKRASA